ncbi:serine/threonine-protein kinase [Nonomuraea guangzhouensis]|uniref:non-specific serine/threonine protein kinase n=1 Tax=Nonomuraea guangzhouensis TaxID=1291555 RepID=A0ABW4G7Y4_9ACTN|nr:serine/threonine-protein kinase [Nonomuraea guangzhouensis]
MTLLADRYRLLSPLGQGGMGIVWRAMDELLRQEVAIKEVRLPPDLDDASRTALAERTLREARAAARLRSHPSIVTVHDVVLDGGRPWIVMELVHGRSLDRVVRDDGPLPTQQVAWIGLRMLDALGAAHAMGVLHRDVKPANVMLTDDGRVLLTDFGIATVAGDAALTQTGLLTGSPGYIAPERLRGEPDGPLSDLWSLGATLFTAVEGGPPFARANAAAVMAAVLMQEPAPARLAGPLGPVLAAILEKDPVRRCAPGQAADWLNGIAQGAPSTDPALHRERTQTGPVRKRSRLPLILLGAGLAVVLALAAGVVVLVRVLPNLNTTFTFSETIGDTPTPAPTSRSTGGTRALFARDFEACGLLTNAQARSLLGGTVKRSFQTAAACMWTRPDNGAFVSVTANRLADVSTARISQQYTVKTMKEEPKRNPGTKVRKGPAVGDEAFSYTRGESIVGTIYRTQISFRVSNVWVIIYHTGRQPGFTTADRTAKLVAKSLDRHR